MLRSDFLIPTMSKLQKTVILTLLCKFTFPERMIFVAGSIPDDVTELYQLN
jgi:hypothetical protein